jgi:hypothetical protein
VVLGFQVGIQSERAVGKELGQEGRQSILEIQRRQGRKKKESMGLSLGLTISYISDLYWS